MADEPPATPSAASNPGRSNSSTSHPPTTSYTMSSHPASNPLNYTDHASSTSAMASSSARASYFPQSQSDVDDYDDPDQFDDYDDDRDSAYGGDSFIGDDTKTLSCYITDYRFEYGRRYHSYRDGAYWVCELVSRISCVGCTGILRAMRSATDRCRDPTTKSPTSSRMSLTICII